MSTGQEGKSSGLTVLWIILGVLGVLSVMCAGVVVVCLVAITTLGRSANATFSGIATAVSVGGPSVGQADEKHPASMLGDSFLAKARQDDVQGVYDQTTQAFRDRVSLEELRKKLQFSAIFREHTSRNITLAHQGPNQVTVNGTLTSPMSVSTFSLRTIREDGTWRIDDIRIP